MNGSTELRIVRTGDSVEVIDMEGRTTGQLCMGECIEQVIGLIYPDNRKTYPMFTPAEWAARSKKHAAEHGSAEESP